MDFENMSAIQDDDSFYEQRAFESGMSVNDYREHLRQKRK